MKACLMKVNYSPKYTTPHQYDNKPYQTLESRLSVMKDMYRPKIPAEKESSGGISKSKTLTSSQLLKSAQPDDSIAKVPSVNKFENSSTKGNGKGKMSPVSNKSKYEGIVDQHKDGIANAHKAMRTQGGLSEQQQRITFSMSWCSENTQLSRLIHGPYSEKMTKKSSHHQSSFQVISQTRKSVQLPSFSSKTADLATRASQGSTLNPGTLPFQRSRTAPDPASILYKSVKSPAMYELERKARIEAERAIKARKVFSIQGPYPSLRQALRRRGWVEKFANAPLPGDVVKKKYEDDAICGDKENRIQPWEEDNGLFGIMSHMVRNCTPTFVFTIKSQHADTRIIKNGQLVNHFGKARHFTTKVGLCQSLKSLPWFENTESDSFYPRCYSMEEPEDKEAFIDDYRLTSCVSFIRYFVKKYENGELPVSEKKSLSENKESTATQKKVEEDSTRCNFKSVSHPQALSDISVAVHVPPVVNLYTATKPKSHPTVSVQALEVAVAECERLLQEREHDDIDNLQESTMTGNQWGQFLSWFYQFVHEDGELNAFTPGMVNHCKELLAKVEQVCPQYSIDGCQNAWILKPGAKSRGRGIETLDKLEAMLSMVDALGPCIVIQKYIEQPMLVHKTKFDIRQWFLVTDWNPITLWFYKHSYLRFCSQEFTLDNFHSAIHLSNNSVQKHFAPSGRRSDKLPDDNMWTSEQFKNYLRSVGQGSAWQELVVPGMKKAIIATLLCTQEFIEPRKSAFELYGADFMMSDDLRPWLIEINSSPTMARNTKATSKLVECVMEDTLKVVLDRKEDKNTDTGDFELAFRQSLINEPPAADTSLAVQGKRVRKKGQKKS